RGEIACRVARTARRLGVATVAVYSEADAEAMHVQQCDEAWLIGPAPARESYLNRQRILDVALRAGAQAVHPGYGFLSENAGFAQACAEAGVVFIGPPVAAIRAMGSKSEAKALMARAGVPLLPGYHGDDQSDDALRQEATRMGYPLLIKATAGGGGKGMRIVESPEAFLEALQAARRESSAAFGDDRVLLERYLLDPRHIELQVFADTKGNVVHLFERDCSIQRRHQKVIEEAPATGIGPELRERMGAAAVDAARAVGYQGAGTVEFLLDSDGNFYFMEMNTRLQVEHPVTEMITGQDLVEWQLRVACGESLPLTQDQLRIDGHAIEARIYAEVPDRDFVPAAGTLHYLQIPEPNTHVRVDSGIQQGDRIGVHYDPMIAKLIAWDRDRPGALRRLRNALADYRIAGLDTNLAFLYTLSSIPAFAEGKVDTGFIGRHRKDLLPPAPHAPPDDILAVAALYELLTERQLSETRRLASGDPGSPWGIGSGWRMNEDNYHSLWFRRDGYQVEVVAHYRQTDFQLELPSGDCRISGQIQPDGDLIAELDGRRVRVSIVRQGEEFTLFERGRIWHLTRYDPRLDAMEGERESGGLLAPMPGTVVAIKVATGDRVSQGDTLLVMEAMKMEHNVNAPSDGEIKEVRFEVGDSVREGDELLVLE
ncbi:MAG: acetyl/propionyl/methylcrotonyl-CoA carboxylase subunit alpha, partial [Gammaproteobacteria bacterium]|nr:acetyl/propionyl/methylcrotonyl-CoA carboxylase subunit alpha [Gammaproteobacteria bacterium]